MKLDLNTLDRLKEASEVVPGNVYPAKGGSGGKRPNTEYWVVLAVTDTMAHLVGFSKEGEVVSTASYYKSALRERPIIGKVAITTVQLTANTP